MTDMRPPVSDAALAAVQGLLPQLAALGGLLRLVVDLEVHGKVIAELREASANAKAEVAKAVQAQTELEAARRERDAGSLAQASRTSQSYAGRT